MFKQKSIELARTWAANSYFDQDDRDQITALLADTEGNEAEIVDSYYKNLEFGTGGLRAVLGIGSNRMNKYNVRKATQAMCNSVLALNIESPKACLSFDCRNFSKEFAMEAASVFAANGIKAYIYTTLTPTPMLSYAIRYFEAHCGIMVTASHNPKQYNGFKAYWSDGAQVTPPYDNNIIDAYAEIQDWNEIKMIDFETGIESGMIEWIEDDCGESFFNLIEKNTLNPKMCKDHGDKVHFIYTPLHGCGYPACDQISKRLGFTNFEIVESQAVADGNFTTIRSTPNPEDPIALELAVALMKESNADIAYGTDPDCDRLGVVVNHKGIEQYLNGNQIAILMIDYIFTERKKNNSLPTNPLVIKSIVTSPLQKTIVEHFGGTVLDTLTGFKWMARLWKDLEDQGTDYNYLFASEESFGYMPYDFVRDKDAVASIALMNEIVLKAKLADKTLIDVLDDIYQEHGYAEESLIALNFEGLEGKDKIAKIMAHFRDGFSNDIAENKIKVFKDFDTLTELNLATKETTPIKMEKSNVLGFEFEDGDILFVRPSGTEPKIKFYTMVQVKDGELNKKKQIAKEKIAKVESFIHATIETI
jgi:phosphoglucomutase